MAECVRQKRESTLERVRRGDERASGGAMKDRKSMAALDDPDAG